MSQTAETARIRISDRTPTLPGEEIADRLLARMGVPGGGQDDDIALVVVRL